MATKKKPVVKNTKTKNLPKISYYEAWQDKCRQVVTLTSKLRKLQKEIRTLKAQIAGMQQAPTSSPEQSEVEETESIEEVVQRNEELAPAFEKEN